MKGRMTAPSQIIQRAERVKIYGELLQVNKKVQLYIDLCYINRMIFLITRSDEINYITIDNIKKKTKGEIIKTLLKIKRIYSSRQFIITDVYADK